MKAYLFFALTFCTVLTLVACEVPNSQNFESDGDLFHWASDYCSEMDPLSSEPSLPGVFFTLPTGFPWAVEIDSQFSANEVDQIKKAIGIWNEFSQKQWQMNAFEITKITARSQSGNEPIRKIYKGCSDSQMKQIGGIFIEKIHFIQQWKNLNLPDDALGASFTCTHDGKAVASTIVVLGDTPSTLLSTAIAHELGHTTGLGHSCEMEANPHSTQCSTYPAGHSAWRAVMFPFLRFPKTGLGRNDMERFQCVWLSALLQN